jgi:hypothetical protein
VSSPPSAAAAGLPISMPALPAKNASPATVAAPMTVDSLRDMMFSPDDDEAARAAFL